jgi:hypothetical protein
LALRQHRYGDLRVFLRAAWAVGVGLDPYKVDADGFHYQYPLLFAILLVPLAEPPLGLLGRGCIPYEVSVALWFGASVCCLTLALRLITESRLFDQDCTQHHEQEMCQTRPMLALLGAAVCFPSIALTLFMGQVNLLLLLLLSGWVATTLRDDNIQAGFWLAGAICLKVIPAFLLIYPIWRRNYACLLSCGLGLLLGLAVVPTVVFGPTHAGAYTKEWVKVLVLPGLGLGEDRSRAHELTDVTHTDSQSLMAIFHNVLHPNRTSRPMQIPRATRWAAVLVGTILTAISLWASSWYRRSAREELLIIGALILVMLAMTPVCHIHYFCLSVPIVIGLLLASQNWVARMSLRRPMRLIFTTVVLSQALPQIPGLEILRDLGLAQVGALLLWGAAIYQLRRSPSIPLCLATKT